MAGGIITTIALLVSAFWFARHSGTRTATPDGAGRGEALRSEQYGQPSGLQTFAHNETSLTRSEGRF